jgi:PIN domain nuclease of toxin-antitoxin system
VQILLDTHALIWHALDLGRLPDGTRDVIENPASTVYVSAASAWEIATKTRLGKMPGGRLASDFVDTVQDEGYHILPVEAQDAQDAGNLPGPHGDPFDRVLAAQALRRGLVLVSADTVLDQFGVERVWA